MERTSLIISEDSNSAYFQFCSGKKSACFNNEKELMHGLSDCFDQGLLTVDEAKNLLGEIESVFTEKKLFKSDYHSPAGFHRHKCKKCNFVWEHDGSFLSSHLCPNCGKDRYRKYFGPQAPSKPAH